MKEKYTEMSEDCPCINEYSNITIENQKESDDFNESDSKLPENILIGNTDLLKIKGLKMFPLGKRWQNNPL